MPAQPNMSPAKHEGDLLVNLDGIRDVWNCRLRQLFERTYVILDGQPLSFVYGHLEYIFVTSGMMAARMARGHVHSTHKTQSRQVNGWLWTTSSYWCGGA